MHREIQRQQASIARERKAWDKLEKLAAAGDLAGFWVAYAAYLEENNLYSPSRKLIHRVAIATAAAINETTNSTKGDWL